MRMSKPPPTFTPTSVKCQGTDSCGAEMEEIQFSDLKRQHHEADSRDQREVSWDEIYINCMGCEKRIQIKGVPEYLMKKVPTS